MQVYSDPRRAQDPFALPDIEVFHVAPTPPHAAGAEPNWFPEGPGWYWWSCSPGCLPDGDPVGPFETQSEALNSAIADGEFA